MDCSTPGFSVTQSLLKLKSPESAMPSSRLILCPPFSSRPQSEWRGSADQQPVQRAASSAVFLSLPPLGRGQLLPCHSLWNSCFLTAQKSGQKEKEFCDFYTVQVARLYSSSNLNMSILDSFLMA